MYDETHPSGTLFEIKDDDEQEARRERTIKPLGETAERASLYPDARTAAAGDRSLSEPTRGMPIIEQSPRYTTPSGHTFISVPGPIPIIKARRQEEPASE